ncbi:MAG: glycosyltransferase family 2 protein [Rhodospirillales bacterium]|nr:MAG: glycosyltransferase family 2 protein [Rhodospirillales bacterium]
MTGAAPAARPLVTALINTYNYGRFLPLAIDSVLAQTYPDIEIVVVDDGSTDDTPEVLARYGDRLRAIRTENGGQAHAFNTGFAAAGGELLMLLDADDLWLPTKVERMVALAAARPEAALLYHQFVNVEANGASQELPLPGALIDGDFSAAFRRYAGSYEHTVTSTMVLRRAHALRLAPLPTYPHREGADSVVADCSLLLGPVASIPEVLAQRRLHGSNWYAAGREGPERSRAVYAADARRVEWRFLSVRRILERLGRGFDVRLEDNDWWLLNRYAVGDATELAMMRVYLRRRDWPLSKRVGAIRGARALRARLAAE